jgi:hypothetical protein
MESVGFILTGNLMKAQGTRYKVQGTSDTGDTFSDKEHG